MNRLIQNSIEDLENIQETAERIKRIYKGSSVKSKDLRRFIEGSTHTLITGCESMKSTLYIVSRGIPFDIDLLLSQFSMISEALLILIEKEQQINSALKLSNEISEMYHCQINFLLSFFEEYCYLIQRDGVSAEDSGIDKISRIFSKLAERVRKVCQ